jgi:hypothetical protein
MQRMELGHRHVGRIANRLGFCEEEECGMQARRFDS